MEISLRYVGGFSFFTLGIKMVGKFKEGNAYRAIGKANRHKFEMFDRYSGK